MIIKKNDFKIEDYYVAVGKSVNEPLKKFIMYFPPLILLVSALFILWLELRFYFDDLYIYENNLSDYEPVFGIKYLYPTIILLIVAIILFVSLKFINHYKTIGNKGEDAIIYNQMNESLIIRRWNYTYEFKMKNIIHLNCKKCMGSSESYAFKRYIPDEKRYVYDIHTYKFSIRKIIFKIKEDNKIYKVTVPVWEGENVYDNIMHNINLMKGNI